MNFTKAYKPLTRYAIIAVVCLCTFGINNLCAQTNNSAVSANSIPTQLVKGTVVDENGMPVPGVSLINSNTKATAETNMDGNFEIVAIADDNLEIKFRDAIVQNITVDTSHKLEIVLTNAQVEQQKTLANYPVSRKVATGTTPVKLAMPDANFFGSFFQYVGRKLK